MKNKILYVIASFLLGCASIFFAQECPQLSHLHVMVNANKNFSNRLVLKSSVGTFFIVLKKQSISELIEYNDKKPNQLVTCVVSVLSDQVGVIIPPDVMGKIKDMGKNQLEDGVSYLGFIGTFPVQTFIEKTDAQNICLQLKEKILNLEEQYPRQTQQEVMVNPKQFSSMQPKDTDNNLSSQKNNTFFMVGGSFVVGLCCGMLLIYAYIINKYPDYDYPPIAWPKS